MTVSPLRVRQRPQTERFWNRPSARTGSSWRTGKRRDRGPERRREWAWSPPPGRDFQALKGAKLRGRVSSPTPARPWLSGGFERPAWSPNPNGPRSSGGCSRSSSSGGEPSGMKGSETPITFAQQLDRRSPEGTLIPIGGVTNGFPPRLVSPAEPDELGRPRDPGGFGILHPAGKLLTQADCPAVRP
jgi:hypothetical protein